MPEYLAVFDHDEADDTITVKGPLSTINPILRQFEWSVFVPNGVRIPASKQPVAEAALRSAGFQISGGSVRRTPRPAGSAHDYPPECANPECGQPYRRGKVVQPGERCYRCEEPLRLRQAYEGRCPGGTACVAQGHNPCPPGKGVAMVAYRFYDALTS